MIVKMNFFEKIALKLARGMATLGHNITRAIARKYDKEGLYNYYCFSSKCDKISFGNNEEES